MREILAMLLMTPAGGEGGSSGSPVVTIVMFGGIILVLYFMMIRPQQKRASEHKKLLEGLKKGDKVLTSSGIHGVVSGLEDNAVLVQISENTKVKFEKNAIATVLKSSE